MMREPDCVWVILCPAFIIKDKNHKVIAEIIETKVFPTNLRYVKCIVYMQ